MNAVALSRVAQSPPAGVFLRRRVGVLFAVICLAILGLSVASTPFADAGQGSANDAAVGGNVVIVQPGDTLWTLARGVQPNGDVRPLVAQLARSHGGSSLRAGDRIALPNR